MALRKELKVYVQRRGGRDRDAAIEACTRKVVGLMMSPRLANTARLTIKLRSCKLKKDTYGLCEVTNLTEQASTKSKHITMVLQRDLPTRELFKTLTHEIKHAHQMLQGRLTRIRKPERGWRWRDNGGPARFYPFGTPYDTRPWEVEARAAERLHEVCEVEARAAERLHKICVDF